MDELAELARYNSLTNVELGQLLSSLTEEQLTRTIGGFFKSITRTVNHILLADIVWLRRITRGVSDVAALESELPKVDKFDFDAVPWPHVDRYLPVRETVDALLERLVAMIPDAKRSELFSYVRANGKQYESLIGHVLLHVFNHQTHHRGQIALMRDELGVENDYSNLIWKV